MEKKVNIELITRHNRVGDDEEVIRQSLSGYCSYNSDTYSIGFEEVEQGAEIRTGIYISQDAVDIIREGAVSSHMILRNDGKRESFIYRTEFGELFFMLEVKKLLIEIEDHGIKLDVDYEVYQGDELISVSNMLLEVLHT